MAQLKQRHGGILLALARSTLDEALHHSASTIPAVNLSESERDWLAGDAAVFVTLRQDDRLRGCIGSIRAYRPLIDDIRGNALSAAFSDPRFSPLKAEELERIEIEISLLSGLEDLHFASQSEAHSLLRPGVDGIVLRWRHRTATFLPQVWEQLPTPRRFLAGLKQKAGLAKDFWDKEIQLQRFTVHKWSEAEAQAQGSELPESLPETR